MPAQYNRPIITEVEALLALPRIIPRTKATPIPTPSIFDEPAYCLKVNKAWAGHFLGLILVMNNPDMWIEDETHDVEWARSQVVEWVAKFLTEDMCMPCCDDLIEQITELVTINTNMLTQITTLVTNITTIINNQVTVIDQNITNEYNQYITAYQNYVTNNQNQNTWNEMFYDGTPESIFPSAGENFNSTGDDALCAAIKTYISAQVYLHSTRETAEAALAGIAAGLVVALGVALSVITGGASAVIGAVAGAAILGVSVWANILNDPEAQRKVRCCMFDSLKYQPLTEANFQTSVTDCGFDSGSNESLLAQAIDNDNFNYPENWLAFLRALNDAHGVTAAECACDCDDAIVLEDFAGTGCTITPMGNCIYRFTQTTLGAGDVYHFSFRDIMSQCLHVEQSADPTKPTIGVGYYTTVVDCHDVETSFPGGFSDVPDGDAPGLISAQWFQGSDQTTYYKITLCADPDGC